MTQPAASQGPSGPNYSAAAAAALKAGNLGLGVKLLQANEEQQRSAQTDQLTNLKIQEAQANLHNQLTTRVAGIAQTILAEPDPVKKAAMAATLYNAHPELKNQFDAYGFNPSTPDHTLQMIVSEAQGVLPTQKPQFTTVGHDQFGNATYGWVNPNTQEVKPIQTGNEASSPAASNINGDAFLQTLPKPLADQIKGYADGRLQFPSGFALKTPYFQKMLQYVAQYDPSFDAINYNSRSKARNDFTSGKSSQNITSFNTAIGHLDSLDKSVDELGNFNTPVMTLLNAPANFIAKNVSPNFQARLKDFQAKKQAVVDELTRAFRGSGGNVHDIAGWERTISESDSPQALHKAVKAAIELLESRIGAIGDQYNRGMGKTSDPMRLLSPKAQAAIARISPESAMNLMPSQASQTPPSATGNQPVQVKSPQEAQQLIQSGKLKSGDTFLDETGTPRVVH